MSSDAKLQKMNLGAEWIDLSFGEPKVVAHALYRSMNRMGFSLTMPSLSQMSKWEYQPAGGNKELTALLEDKYSARVVVCNGAKQALAAATYSMSKLVKPTTMVPSIYYDVPYYPANPVACDRAKMYRTDDPDLADCLLITSPNNPDGRCYTNSQLIEMQTKKPLIHDAAYYTPIYLPESVFPIPIGKIQLFSMSKMYGLSGLRVGYAVCHDDAFHKHMTDFMEETTSGVSILSQQVVLEIERTFVDHPDWRLEFESESRDAIANARKEIDAVDPDVFTVVPAQCNSMFVWAKVGPALDYNAAKVYMLPGDLFGKPGMVRLNIAHPVETIREAVSRLNKHKIRS